MKRLGIFTGTRADYGLLRPLIRQLKADQSFDVRVIASGSHFQREFGETHREIEVDGFTIDEKVDMLLASDSAEAMAKSLGLGVILYTDALTRQALDGVVILGDRYEALAMATAATVLGVPIFHLHGGELTLGAIDDAFRHAITKMATLHFTSTEIYRNRVIQLGESPERVFNVGAIGVDNIRSLKLLDRPALEKELAIYFRKTNFLVGFHPETAAHGAAKEQVHELLEALDELLKTQESQVVFTKANADAEGRLVNEMVEAFVARRPTQAHCFSSLGSLRYLSLLKASDVLIGNSSSGIIEAPSLNTPTVNIGNRQGGRLRAASVVDCEAKKASILKAVTHALEPGFRKSALNSPNPYGDGKTTEKIVAIFRKYDFKCANKIFHDLPQITQGRTEQ
ncbi:MAG: UDP-N-acetyl-D-glucosamine 2-epimerase, UDP-hydrolysing [Bdellovibrionales bacterium RIFOXYC1_FULL_54_43]|nr:MAG: UDP-N-acetyl-D-glucosamine 2-epimerase, UDP-hydrolysing [Bdellovibrionales bacterium RIFOXYC1_FULL_54_43]OFZ83946.1 MAG: UDP-N-acetyl-D-glucosamine 2-epimerase, UDP-hydrolysing [Bdellovibrionales bacterium RIFOXYD1_FULL_55_31]